MFTIKLPTGLEVTFRAPSFEDRRNILREFDRNGGYLAEDLLAATCLTHINGAPVEPSWSVEPINLFSAWDLRDQSFYMEVFMNMFSLDDKAKKLAEEQAKKLMNGMPTTERVKAVKAPTGNVAA